MTRPHKMARVEEPTTDLDPDGDMRLVLEHTGYTPKSYLVSSKVLTVASPVFRTMLGPNFKEDAARLAPALPEFTLKEDDRKAMDRILRLLHHRSYESSEMPPPTDVVAIAIHGDKYDIFNALSPFLTLWCGQHCHEDALRDEEAIGLMLMTTWMHKSIYFPRVASIAARSLAPGFEERWNNHTGLQQIDPAALSFLRDLIYLCKNTISITVQEAMGDLSTHSKASQADCTPGSRLTSLIIMLKNNDLWPISSKCEEKTINQVLATLRQGFGRTYCSCIQAGCPCVVFTKSRTGLNFVEKAVDARLEPQVIQKLKYEYLTAHDKGRR